MVEVKIETSWDDGYKQDLRLSDLLVKYSIPAIFYIPAGITNLTEDELRLLSSRHEIGNHTLTHPYDMKLLSPSSQYYEISKCSELLKNITGKEITKFCYPRGRYNLVTIEQLKKCGIIEARTTNVGHIEDNEDRYRKNTTVHCFQRKEYKGEDWLVYAKRKLREVVKKGGTYHLWGHSWEIDRNNDWDKLEKIFIEINQKNEILHSK